MDRKTFAIVLLTLTALLLTGVAVQGLLPTMQPAYAQSGRFADYAMVPVEIADRVEALCVIDTTTQRMVFFKYPGGEKMLEPMGPAAKADLRRDFGAEGP
jgi:hypothetical protein